MVICVNARATITNPHQGRSSQPEKSIELGALVVVIEGSRHSTRMLPPSPGFLRKSLGQRNFYKTCGIKAVHALEVRRKAQALTRIEGDARRGERRGARKRAEFRVLAQETVGHGVVFLLQDTARRVDQTTTGLHQPGGGLENRALFRSQLGDGARPVTPLEVGIAPQGAEAAAGRVDQHAVELAR